MNYSLKNLRIVNENAVIDLWSGPQMVLTGELNWVLETARSRDYRIDPLDIKQVQDELDKIPLYRVNA